MVGKTQTSNCKRAHYLIEPLFETTGFKLVCFNEDKTFAFEALFRKYLEAEDYGESFLEYKRLKTEKEKLFKI